MVAAGQVPCEAGAVSQGRWLRWHQGGSLRMEGSGLDHREHGMGTGMRVAAWTPWHPWGQAPSTMEGKGHKPVFDPSWDKESLSRSCHN